MAPLLSNTAITRPQAVAGFTLESVAGAGGMGTVYRARDEVTGEPVALKLLTAHRRPQEAKRFAREARLLSELNHPGIVRYLAHGVSEAGEPFLAMEWLTGEDLEQRLDRGALSLEESLALLSCVAEALAFLHGRGVVHRDLKPSNIFLRGGEASGAVILDFGIARGAEPSRALTGTGAALGTPGYMAPEQVRGALALSAAADVFSLGCVLFECLTGQPPFVAPHVMAVLAKVLFDEPPKLREVRKEMPASLEALLSRMLAKDEAQRPTDAAAVLDALGALDLSAGGVEEPSTRARVTEDEQHLISVIMAALPSDEPKGSLTATLSDEPIAALRRDLVVLGARIEVLWDGSLVATLSRGQEGTTDQAAQAARCALVIKAAWPAATIAVATGRGRLEARVPAGEVFDRAAALVRERPTGEAISSRILIDEVTRGLLDLRYRVERTSSGGYALSGEELSPDASRPLLGKPTPCVGRDVELGLLESLLTASIEEAEPRAALVTAPAGAGKSRLMHELLRRVTGRDEEVLVLIGRGDPMSAGSSYGLLGEALRRLCGIVDGEELSARREKLAQRLGERLPPEERARVTAFVGELSGVPFPDDDDVSLRAARQDPALMCEQMTRAALDLLRAEGEAQPLLLLLENLHWGDAQTVRFCEIAMRELKGVPLLLLGFARPEVEELFPRLWAGAAQGVPLRPLSKKAAARLVTQVLGKEVPAEAVSRIVEQSEGNALFLEELIRAVAEGQGDEAPETVLAMLQGRIGRLPAEARRALRAASVFGERAWVSGIEVLLGEALSRHELEGQIARLLEAEILEERRESRFPGEREVRFRHALMRDAAYGLLTDEVKAAAHRLAGAYLEARGEPDALVLAEHFVQGREPESAIPYFLHAAEQSYEANAMAETLSSVERALACSPTGELRGALLSLQVAVYVGRQRYAEVVALATEAIALLEEGSPRWCRCFEPLFLATAVIHQETLAELAAPFTRVEPSFDARGDYVRAALVLVVVLLLAGDEPGARALMLRAYEAGSALDRGDVSIRAYSHTAEAKLIHLAKASPWSCALHYAAARDAFRAAALPRYQCIMSAFHGIVLYKLGDCEGGERELRESISLGESLKEPFTVSHAKVFLARCLAASAPLDALDEPLGLAREVIAAQDQTLVGAAHGAIATIKRRRGDLVGAEEEARAACEATREVPPWSWDLIALRVDLLLALGRTAEALTCSEEGVSHLERLGLQGYGELPLRLSLVEARQAAGQADAARAALEKLVAALRLRLTDFPGAPTRERYVTKVPTNARIAALARERLGVEVLAGW